MKYIILISLSYLLLGCSRIHYLTPPEDLALVAKVVSGKSKDQEGNLKVVEIRSIDEKYLKQTFEIYLSPGIHKIGYLCPGWLYVDYPPERTVIVSAGKEYVLLCNSKNNKAWLEEIKSRE